MKLHILYLTNKCNFKCLYCYEHNIPDEKIISYDEIDELLDYIVKTEPNDISTLCLFGGEPLLEFRKIQYIHNKCLSIKKNKGKAITLNIITNGSLIHVYLKDIMKMVSSSEIYTSLDISFDGDFQSRRTTSDIVEKNLKLLILNKVPFGISYTVSFENANILVLVKDLIKIIHNYMLVPYAGEKRRKIKVSFDRERIKSITGEGNDNFKEYIQKLKKYLVYVYQKFKVPFCEIICDECGKCNKQVFTCANYIAAHSKYIEEGIHTKDNLFNHW